MELERKKQEIESEIKRLKEQEDKEDQVSARGDSLFQNSVNLEDVKADNSALSSLISSFKAYLENQREQPQIQKQGETFLREFDTFQKRSAEFMPLRKPRDCESEQEKE